MSLVRRVLVINDDPAQLRMITKPLRDWGHEVVEHTDPVRALRELPEMPNIDLCIVDLHMPGIDGWKICRLLRSPDFDRYREVPILVVSATFSGVDVEEITTDLDANAFLGSPFSTAELRQHVQALLEGEEPSHRSTLLVVEDDASIRRSVTRAFSDLSFEVTEAATVKEAVTLWQENRPDVVITDYYLPDGTCEALLRKCHSPASHTVVLAMTGDPDPSLPVTLLSLGADGYAQKPFDPAFLVEQVARARRERSLLRVEAILEQRTAQLRASEARYTSLFESIPDPVIVVAADHRITTANRAAERALCRGNEGLVGCALEEIIDGEDAARFLEGIANVPTGSSETFDVRLRPESGPSIMAEVTAERPKDDGPDAPPAAALVLVCRDITRRRRAEERRVESRERAFHEQRLESLGVLAARIAHDFNNLLACIMGNVELALLSLPPGNGLRDQLTQIATAAQRGAGLTNQILTFSGKGTIELKPVELSSRVSEIGRLLEQAVAPGVHLSFELEADLPFIEGNASQLDQAIMNLIMNASEAHGNSPGTIRIGTSLRQRPATAEARLAGGAEPSESGPWVCIEVADEGCGIADDVLEHIFDPFFSAKSKGRGLGLATTLGIVKGHGGIMTVDTEVARGTTIRMWFPVAEGLKEAVPDADRSSVRDAHRQRHTRPSPNHPPGSNHHPRWIRGERRTG